MGRHQSERWHPILTTNNNGDANGENPPPTLRVKCRYQTLEVLPTHLYDPLLHYLRDNYTKLLEYLEPVIGKLIKVTFILVEIINSDRILLNKFDILQV